MTPCWHHEQHVSTATLTVAADCQQAGLQQLARLAKEQAALHVHTGSQPADANMHARHYTCSARK